ncbi:hypothetical protein BDF19DRAFT_227172 [Syncephalis fuscata]|nr:hypothetical protein BDF19DRAFT_227172 [Syncephalis fuscata]
MQTFSLAGPVNGLPQSQPTLRYAIVLILVLCMIVPELFSAVIASHNYNHAKNAVKNKDALATQHEDELPLNMAVALKPDAQIVNTKVLQAVNDDALPNRRRLQPRGVIPTQDISMMLVVTVDGTINAVHKKTGKILWTQKDLGGNLVSTGVSQAEQDQIDEIINNESTSTETEKIYSKKKKKEKETAKLKNDSKLQKKKQLNEEHKSTVPLADESLLISTANKDKNANKQDPINEILYFPEPAGDGALYVYASGKGLQKLPYSIRYLVSSSPFGAIDGAAYVAAQQSTLFAIDPHTGALLKRYNVGGQDIRHDNPSLPSDAILLGRQDYTLTIYDTHQSSVKWNISYGEFTYTKPDSTIAVPSRNTIGNIAIKSDGDGDIITGINSGSYIN